MGCAVGVSDVAPIMHCCHCRLAYFPGVDLRTCTCHKFGKLVSEGDAKDQVDSAFPPSELLVVIQCVLVLCRAHSASAKQKKEHRLKQALFEGTSNRGPGHIIIIIEDCYNKEEII